MPYGDYNRPREPHPATPFLFLQTRTLETTWDADFIFYWDIEAVNTQDFRYKTNETKIFILTAGYYEIIYELSVHLDYGAMSYAVFALYKNDAIIPGSEAWSRFPDDMPTSISAHYYTYLNRGDYLELYCHVGVGGGTLRAAQNSVRFIIKGMDMEGWNNNAGGKNNGRRI